MAQDGVFFKKAAELNHASVPYSFHLGFGFVSDWEIW
jgi:hypothetical protein